jgi:hypothetical protein
LLFDFAGTAFGDAGPLSSETFELKGLTLLEQDT